MTVLYIVFTTGRCNLKCEYCGGSFPESLVPYEVKYGVDDLKRFISDDPAPTICFYGGEPLLNRNFIRNIMDEIPRARFVVQTNGTLVKRLEPEYWRRFETVLLSIDGRQEVTDRYRGSGVYRRVLEAARWLRLNGFRGDLIARMTVTEITDIYLDVKHLLELGLFDHVHWQLDVVWSNRWRDFDGWCERSYLPGLKRLINLWLDEAERGTVLGIVPIIGVLGPMIKGERLDCPPCGAGKTSLAISTDGTILACPIAVDARWARLGNIIEDSRLKVVGKVGIGEPCLSCTYLKYCGGRCLYSHIERLWGEDGFRRVCRVTIKLIEGLLEIKGRVIDLLREGTISLKELSYPPFNNTTEIIP